jgi:UDP-2-acetamido-3-amino-2,3-dideoxy-glucuronate N-acetyltransferase
LEENSFFVSPLAIVEAGVQIGQGSKVWEFSKIRSGAVLGNNVTIGMNVYIGPGVVIGDDCKIQNNASLYEPANIGKGVFVGPGAILTNDKHPRATGPTGEKLGDGEWKRVGVTLKDNCSIGAGAICVAPVTIGSGSLVGAGAVVTRDIPSNEVWVGIPANARN